MFISWAPSPVLSAGTSTSASTISITDSPTDITKSQLTAPNVTVSQKASELDAIFSDKTTTDLQVDVQTSEATLLIAGRSELSDEFRHQLDEWARSTSVNLETQSTDGSLATEGRPIVDSDLTLIAGINEVTTNGHQPDVNSDKYFQSSDFPDNTIFTRQQGVTDDVGVSGRLSDQNKILQRRPPTEGDHPVPGHGEEDVGNKEDVTKAEIREAGNEELPDASTSASASAGHIIMSAPGILHGHHAALNYSSLQQLPSLNLNMKNETKPSWKNETGERRAVAGSLYKCCWAQCEVAFGTLNQLVNHVNDIHVRIETDIEYRCQWENCPRKGKGFNARYKLLIHVRTHTNEKPHHCKLCDKSFARLENLKIHMRSHTGEKPYICPFEGCGKAYSNSSDRFKHVRTHQINKPYVCRMPGCGKSYTDPSSLRKHVKCHHHYWKGDDKQVDPSLSWTDDGCEELRMDTLPSDAAPASQLTDATSESHTATMPDDTNMTSISTIDAAVSAVSTSQCSTPTLVSLSATNGGFATLGGTLVPLAGATLQPQMISIQGNMLQVAALTANPLLSSAVILPNVSTTSTSTQTDAIISHLSDSTDKDIIALSNCVQESPLDLSTSPLPSHGEENSTDLTHFSAKWDLMATD